jgi:hypothetical protein
LQVVELPPRREIKFDTPSAVAGTYQGLWPGINIQDDKAKAAPTGAPWIDTNTGFLRFLRALTTKPVWIANTPPPKTVVPVARYIQAIGDAAIAGARWVAAFDDDFSKRLLAGEPAALRDWKRIAEHLRFYENNQWANLEPAGQFALVQDAAGGALLSGGILDMIATRHTPVRAIPVPTLSDNRMRGSKVAVNVDPTALDDERKQVLRRFTSGGGMLLSGPPGWKFSGSDAITVSKDDVEKLDGIWREVNSVIGRRNLGARLFNVSSMLSNLVGTPAGDKLVLHLVNYSGYPVENITVHLLGEYKKAAFYTPGAPVRELKPYSIEEGTGIDIDKIDVVGALVTER